MLLSGLFVELAESTRLARFARIYLEIIQTPEPLHAIPKIKRRLMWNKSLRLGLPLSSKGCAGAQRCA